jgi:hypothetical protein
MESERPPAGWYRDPGDAGRQRYWDGTRWAALTRSLTDPPPAAKPEPGPVGSPGNPIGAGSSALAAALINASAMTEPRPAAEPSAERRPLRKLFRSRAAG